MPYISMTLDYKDDSGCKEREVEGGLRELVGDAEKVEHHSRMPSIQELLGGIIALEEITYDVGDGGKVRISQPRVTGRYFRKVSFLDISEESEVYNRWVAKLTELEFKSPEEEHTEEEKQQVFDRLVAKIVGDF